MTRLSVPFAQWPAADREMCEQLFATGDPLDEAGCLSHLGDFARQNIVFGYGLWLGWLHAHAPECLSLDPVSRATGQRITAWLADRNHLNPQTRLSNLENTMRPLRAMAPDHDWSQQRRLASVLRREVRDHISDRKTGRVLPTATLLNAGLAHAAGANLLDGSTALMRARHARDGAMIAFLALIPIRRRALVELQIGSSLIMDRDRILISLDGWMTKNRQAFDCALPDVLQTPMQRYLVEVRPWLLARTGSVADQVWVGDEGRPYHPSHMTQRVTRITEKLVNVRVSPHLFRDSVTTTLARTSPDAARLSRAILGHSGFRTATRHYNHARMIESGRDYADLIDTLRSEEP